MSTIKEIKFVYTFTEEETERLRVSVLKSKGQILKFVVQLEIKIGNFWKPIVRYDTAHGYSHKDIIRADGSIEKQQGDLRTRSLKVGATTVAQLRGKNPAGISGTTLIT